MVCSECAEFMKTTPIYPPYMSNRKSTQLSPQCLRSSPRFLSFPIPETHAFESNPYQSFFTGEFYFGRFVDAKGNPYGPFATSEKYFEQDAGRKIEAKHYRWREKDEQSKRKSREVCALYRRAASLLTDQCVPPTS